MRKRASVFIGLFSIFVALSAGAADGNAWRRDNHNPDRGPGPRQYMDSRYDHNHAYPARGVIVRDVPRERVVVYDRMHRPYYQYGGVWYAQRRSGFVVVGPPVGVFVNTLPPFYTTVWFGGVPYYYANDTYYRWHETEREYEVVDAPQGSPSTGNATASSQPNADANVFVYPKNGQDSEQTARDRYDCHRWAVTETGFDPTQSGGNVAEDQRSSKRADYQRAQTACLEGRGYSVK